MTSMFKSLLKSKLDPSGKVYKIFSYAYNYHEKGYKPRRIKGLNQVLENFSKANPRINFIQVGSNDGISGDPINYFVNHYEWFGILIEPVPFLFAQLKKNYSQHLQKLQFLNIAVGSGEETEKVIYVFDEKYRGQVPDWCYQLGSFYKSVIYHHDIPNVDDYIVELKVSVQSLQSVIESNLGNQILNFLHVDTEGYDFEIIKLLDFSKTKPELILVEFIHLSVYDRKCMIKLLKSQGYQIYQCEQDYLAIQQKVHKSYMTGTKVLPFWEY